MKYSNFRLTFFLVMGSISILSGCTSRVAMDIRIDSVDLVKRDDVGQYVDVSGRNGYILEREFSDFLLLRISTAFDFLEFISDPGKSIFVTGNFCNDPKTEVGIAAADLYLNGRPIQSYVSEKAQIGGLRNSDDRLVYKIVIFSKSAPDVGEGQRYNLLLNPNDVCIKISGGDMVSTYTSEVLVLTASQIGAAFSSGDDGS